LAQAGPELRPGSEGARLPDLPSEGGSGMAQKRPTAREVFWGMVREKQRPFADSSNADEESHEGANDSSMLKRDSISHEVMLLAVQFWLFAGPVLLALACLAAWHVGEPVAGLPRRIFEDFFGPFGGVYEMRGPPLMSRARFEQPENVVHRALFRDDSAIGWSQDVGIWVWNWGARSLWQGGIFSRIVAVTLAACFWAPWLVAFASIPQLSFLAAPSLMPAAVKGAYLRRFPACLLTLDQLIAAHKQYGRQLPEVYQAEVESYNSKLERYDTQAEADGDPATIETGEVNGASRRRHPGQ